MVHAAQQRVHRVSPLRAQIRREVVRRDNRAVQRDRPSTRVDLFLLWYAVLIVTGCVGVMKLSKGQGIAVATILWLFGTLIAVGGGTGTLSEIAFGLQFGRPVFALDGAPEGTLVVAAEQTLGRGRSGRSWAPG